MKCRDSLQKTQLERHSAKAPSLFQECENLRQEADNHRRRCGQATRESQRLKQQTVDLGQQVSSAQLCCVSVPWFVYMFVAKSRIGILSNLIHGAADVFQVRMLLKELEEARGTVVTTGRDDLNISSDEVSSSSQLISEKLVSFRSVVFRNV